MLENLFIVKAIKDLDIMFAGTMEDNNYNKILEDSKVLSEEIKKTIDNTFNKLDTKEMEISYSEMEEFCKYKEDLASKVLFDLFKEYLSFGKKT